MNNIKVWLIGDTITGFDRTKLPTALDVLKFFFHHQRIGRKKIGESETKVAQEVKSIWKETGIPTLLLRNVILKIDRMKKKYEILKKTRYRRTETQLQRELQFKEELERVFDIISQANTSLSIEQRQFLTDQRGLRQLQLSSCKPLAEAFILPKVTEAESEYCENEVSSQSDSDGSDFEDSLPDNLKLRANAFSPQILNTILNSNDVASTADRIKLTDGKFTLIACAFARACGEDIGESIVSRSTVSRKRDHHRKVIVDQVKQEFFEQLEQDKFGLVIHFDGKLLPNYTADNSEDRQSKVERIAIVLTGNKMEQLLGVVTAEDGKGATATESVNRMLSEWDVWNQTNGKNKSIRIRHRIIGMSFDTTNSNTCKIFEEKYMKRKLLHFACRHHVFEVVIGGIFKKLFGDTEGPDVSIFNRFKAEWKNINKKKFKSLEETHFKKPFAASQRMQTIEFLLEALSSEKTYTPRDDYKELMELCLLVLGHPLANYVFKAPGATHHARWMSKIIYSFKIFLFRNQFSLSREEKSNFKEMTLLASLLYVKAWIRCPLTSDAPVNDLRFFKQLKEYAVVSKLVSAVAIKKFEGHLWYLGPELVVLCLFSNEVSSEEKHEILIKMHEKKVRGIRLKESLNLHQKKLSDLISIQSMSAINNLQLNLDFMHNLDVEKWPESEEYKSAKSYVDQISVVNDAAERSLALMTNFNENFTRKESKKQLVLQVVQDNRKRIKGCNKKTLSTYQLR